MKYLNKYHLYARYIPGLITVLPVTMIYFFVTQKYSRLALADYAVFLNITLSFSLTLVVGYVAGMISRELGTFLERKYFLNRTNFPTAYLMLHQSEKFPQQVKRRYTDKIYQDFGLQLLSEKKEKNNPQEALKILSQAARLLATTYQQNSQVKDANIAYGFARNVSGGLILSIPISLSGVVIGALMHLPAMTVWLSAVSILYVLLGIFHKKWIIVNAEKYAEKLLAVYLSQQIRLLWGYGERPARVFGISFATILIFAAAFFAIRDPVMTTHQHPFNALYYSMATFATMGTGEDVEHAGQLFRWLTALEALCGMALWGLLISGFAAKARDY